MKSLLLVLAFLVPCFPAPGQPCVPNPLKDIQVTVSPEYAPPGQPITVTLTNVSTNCYYFQSSSCVFGGVKQNDCSGIGMVLLSCASIMSIVPPSASASQVWDQTDGKGKQVPNGTYAFALTWLDPNQVPIPQCPTVTIGNGCPPPHTYGAASKGSGAIEPTIAASGDPKVGSPGFQVSVTGGLGGAPMLLFAGLGQGLLTTGWGTFLIDPALPYLQFPIPLGGAPGVPGAGAVTLTSPIPGNPAIGGVQMYLQALIGDPGATGGICHTAGLTFGICP